MRVMCENETQLKLVILKTTNSKQVELLQIKKAICENEKQHNSIKADYKESHQQVQSHQILKVVCENQSQQRLIVETD